LDLEIVCVLGSDDARRALAVFTSDERFRRGNPIAPVANPLGLHFLDHVLRIGSAPELDLFHAVQRVGRAEELETVARPELAHIRSAVHVAAAAARGRVDSTGPDLDVCRVSLPSVIVSVPLVESWRTARGEIKMSEQDQIKVVAAAPGMAEAVLVHLVRERSVETFVQRCCDAFDVLRRYRSALQEARQSLLAHGSSS
jgi:hypothetical protein